MNRADVFEVTRLRERETVLRKRDGQPEGCQRSQLVVIELLTRDQEPRVRLLVFTAGVGRASAWNELLEHVTRFGAERHRVRLGRIMGLEEGDGLSDPDVDRRGVEADVRNTFVPRADENGRVAILVLEVLGRCRGDAAM